MTVLTAFVNDTDFCHATINKKDCSFHFDTFQNQSLNEKHGDQNLYSIITSRIYLNI